MPDPCNQSDHLTGSLSSELLSRLSLAITELGGGSFFEEFLEFFKALVFFDSALALCYHRQRRPDILYDALRNPLRSNSASLYVAGAYLLDPFFLRAMRTDRNRVVRFQDIVSDEFPDSEYYLSYYQRSSVVDEVNVIVPFDSSSVLAVCIERSTFYEGFSRKDLNELNFWLPTISVLLRKHWQIVRRAMGAAADDPEHERLALALERFGSPVLTPREGEVVQLMLRGYSPSRIAESIGAAVETVRVHRRNIYRKLRVSSLAELFALALNEIGVAMPQP